MSRVPLQLPAPVAAPVSAADLVGLLRRQGARPEPGAPYVPPPQPRADPRTCPHERFTSQTGVHRIELLGGPSWVLSVEIVCNQCGTLFARDDGRPLHEFVRPKTAAGG